MYKYLIGALILFASCKNCEHLIKTEYVYKIDTIYVEKVIVDTFVVKEIDSARIKQLTQENNFLNLTIQNMEDYVQIVRRNSSQTKFLVGWLNRPLNDYKEFKKSKK